MNPTPWRESANLRSALLGLLLALIFIGPIRCWDTWWQLDSGLWMLDHGTILTEEVRSFTFRGEHWTNFAWTFQLLLALTYKAGGFWGMIALQGAMLAVFFTLLIRLSLGHRQPLLPLLLALVPVTGQFIATKFFLRPHLLEFIWVITLLVIMERMRGRNQVLGFVLLLLAWANTHASAVVGATAAGLHLLFDSRVIADEPRWQRRFTLALLLAPPLFCTPHTWRIIQVLLSHSQKENIFWIQEWYPLETFPWLLTILVAVYFIRLLLKEERFRPGELFLVLFFYYFSWKHVRFTAEAAMLMVRPLTALLTALYERLATPRPALPRLAYAFLLLALLGLYPPHLAWKPGELFRFPVDWSVYPRETIQVLDRLSAGRNQPLKVLNRYHLGGYLSWAMQGRAALFIDGRTPTVFSGDHLETHVLSLGSRWAMERVNDRYGGLDALLFARDQDPLIPPRDPVWKLAAFDQAAVLFVRRTVAGAELLPEIPYPPHKLDLEPKAEEVEAAVTATRQLLTLTPDNALAWAHLGLWLGQTPDASPARRAEAADAMAHALPWFDDPMFKVLLAQYLLEGKQDPAAAAAVILTLDKLPLTKPPFLENMAAPVLLRLGRPGAALVHLYPRNPERRRLLDGLFLTWFHRGLAEAMLGRFVEARRSYGFAFLLLDPTQPGHVEKLEQLAALFPTPPPASPPTS